MVRIGVRIRFSVWLFTRISATLDSLVYLNSVFSVHPVRFIVYVPWNLSTLIIVVGLVPTIYAGFLFDVTTVISGC